MTTASLLPIEPRRSKHIPVPMRAKTSHPASARWLCIRVSPVRHFASHPRWHI